MEAQNTAAVATQQSDPTKGTTIFQVAGQDVKLSFDIVRNFLTKGNGDVTDQDLVQFISICKFNQLNPFLNEAFLIKFGSAPAQMIVSKEALMKRAEACEQYNGIKGGVIVLRKGEIIDLEGCFKLETDELVGGWSEVHRKDRKFPTIARVALSEYDKKQSIWNDKKSTMISKVAKVQALREAFPTQLGAMYTAEERNIQDIAFTDVTHVVDAQIKAEANGETLSVNPTLSATPTPSPEEAAFNQERPTATQNPPAADPQAPQTPPAPQPVGQQPMPEIFAQR